METFGRYRLVERLAVGGMAEIFLARSSSLDGFEKDLVIKRIRPEYGGDQRFASMFIDEARLSMSLSHPNVVQVFDFGQTDGDYYLAMEHVDGFDLDGLLAQPHVDGQGLDPALALLIARDVCTGLEYAHNKRGRKGETLNVIHRDISPHNILVSLDGCAKVTDFGIAKALGNVNATEPGVVMGKFNYMSPEQAEGYELDRRADIFSLGVVLWEALVGQRTHEGAEGLGLFDRILNARIEPPSQRKPGLPATLDELVMKALNKDPAARYATARAFGEALHRHLVSHYPQASAFTLQEFLMTQRGVTPDPQAAGTEPLPTGSNPKRVPEPDDGGTAMLLGPQDHEPIEPTMIVEPLEIDDDFGWTPAVCKLVERFNERPSLWRIVELGDTCEREGQKRAALAAYRVAAVKFAQHGLLAQSMLCASRMLRHQPPGPRAVLKELPAIAGQTNEQVAPMLFARSGPVEDLLAQMLADSPTSSDSNTEGTALLRKLDGEAFVRLAESAPLRTYAPDTPIVTQGDGGQAMYLIARGRVMIFATTDEGGRIYLSSLMAGDFFGENSFFTGSPRSATVEALYPVEAFEIDRTVYREVMADIPLAEDILLYFYKERIVDAVLAKSPIFGLLPNEDRRAILDHFELRSFGPGDTVIEEGELSDQIYVIKSGEAEVSTTMGEERHILSTLGGGRLFGEVAALRHIPRTASVVATTRLETLSLTADEFQQILAKRPELRKHVDEVLTKRVRENIEKLTSAQPQL